MTFLILALILCTVVVALIVAIHPFWAIIECAVSDRMNGTRKGLWILAMLLTWTLASFLYGLFATSSVTLRRVSRGCTLLIILVLLGCGFLIVTNPELQDALRNSTELTKSGGAPTPAANIQELESPPNPTTS